LVDDLYTQPLGLCLELVDFRFALGRVIIKVTQNEPVRSWGNLTIGDTIFGNLGVDHTPYFLDHVDEQSSVASSFPAQVKTTGERKVLRLSTSE
jgi:hypothetical protein